MKAILAMLATLIIAGCNCHEEPCTHGAIGIQLKGFSFPDIDTIILRRYITGGSYTRYIDSARLDPVFYSASTGNLSDTSIYIQAGYDLELFFPAVNKTVRFYDIIDEGSSERVCNNMGFDPSPRCIAKALSYVQDSVRYNYNADTPVYAVIRK